MSYRSQVLAAVLCTMALADSCVAQTYTDFAIASSADHNVDNSGWVPNNIYAVDVNNDGIPDLIQDLAHTGPDYGNGTFGVSIANGDGTFKRAVAYSYPPKMLGGLPMAFGDFNGDGKIDIAMSAGGNTIAIYLGNGDGTFVNPWYSVVPLATGQWLAGALVATDFNHDGKLDLAVAGTSGADGTTTVYILPGNGKGLFSDAMPVFSAPTGMNSSNSAVQNLLIGDFDSDDNADLAILVTTGNNEGDVATSTIHVLYGNGDFSFLDTVPYSQNGALPLNAGDLNSDGYTDLFALDGGNSRLETFYGQADRTFASYSAPIPPASYTVYTLQNMPTLGMADFNDDGRMDMVVKTTSYLVFFLAGSNPGEFDTQTWNITSYPYLYLTTSPAVGDFNGDGSPDWAIVQSYNDDTAIYYAGLNATAHGNWSNCPYPSIGRGISLCSPTSLSTSPVNFDATAHSFGQLRKMEVWVDGNKLDEQHNTWGRNGFLNFSTSSLAPGSHRGTIYAADIDNTLQRYDFNFTVGPSSCGAPSSPGVNICLPVNGSTTSATPVLVQATATIEGTLARMEIWVDGVKKYTETNSTALNASINLRAGSHVFTIYAANTDGALWDQTITATVP